MYVLNFIRGFCMAMADSVPGVSGGTIAFILGFYDDFINSLNTLVSGSRNKKLKALKFLCKLGVGWIVGFILSVIFITSVFEKHIYEINSLFLGFIIASIPLILKEEKKSIKGKSKNIIFLILGIIVVWAITYYNPMGQGSQSFSVRSENLNPQFVGYIFVSAMVAISAMVLPGISGSTILLIFGLYTSILKAIKGMLQLNFEYLPAILIFLAGIVAGIIVTIRVVRFLLKNYRSETIYCVIGLMIGSLYAVVMGPTSLEVPKDPMSLETFSILFFALGCVLVYSLEGVKTLLENKLKDKSEIDFDIDNDKIKVGTRSKNSKKK